MTAALTIGLKVSLVLFLALLGALALRRRSAAIRHWILAAGIGCALLVPALSVALPTWQVWPTTSSVAPVDVQTSIVVPDAIGRPNGPPAAAEPMAIDTGLIVGGIWMAGSLAMVASLLLGLRRLTRLTAAGRPAGGAWLTEPARLRAAGRLRRPVQWIETTHPALLVTWGLRRAVVLLPCGASQWPSDRVRMVVGHEMAHIQRADWVTQLAGELLRIAWWFNPLVWMACRRLRLEAELACDDEVLRRGDDGRDYAETLVSIAREFADAGPALPAPAIARQSTLQRRVRAMLNPGLDRRPLSLRLRLVAGVALSAVILPVALAGSQAVATLSGTIVDSTGARLPGVEIVLKHGGNVTIQTRSDASGTYRLPLAPGDYALEARLPGFRAWTDNLTIGSGEAAVRDVELSLGTLSESVNVVRGEPSRPASSIPPVATTTAAVPSCTPLAPSTTARVGGNLKAPRKILDVKPIYPAGAAEAGDPHIVRIEARIGEEGTVTEARVVEPLSPEFDEAALAAVRQWQFTPTLLNCEPMEVAMTVKVTFQSQR